MSRTSARKPIVDAIALPPNFWQLMQWHTDEKRGSPCISYVTEAHQQLPFVGFTAGAEVLDMELMGPVVIAQK